MNKDQLIDIIDLLGVYDLTEEVRQILDQTLIKRIHAGLKLTQRQFLRVCLNQKEKIAAPPLELKKWDGDPKKLNLMLHRRGLARLSKALCGQHPDLVWHITHTLDTGRGAILNKGFSPQAVPGITHALVQQVVNLLNFLNIKSVVHE